MIETVLISIFVVIAALFGGVVFGKTAYKLKIQKKKNETLKKHQEIDGKNISADDAYNGLRK